MKTRALLVALAALLLLLAGVLGYRRAAAGSAADCGDKPKPKDEFTMAAPCDGGADGAGAPGRPAPAPATEPR